MLTIGEFSKICRVSTKTLRYYDQIGLLKPGHVGRDSGYRYYEVSQLKDMLLISRLKQYQFSLPEIAAVMAKNDNRYLAGLIRAKQEELKKRLDHQEYVLRLMERDVEKIERCEDIMESRYVIRTTRVEPKNIYSIRKKIGLKEFESAFGELCAGLEKNRLKPVGPFLAVYHDEDFNPESADIEVGAMVSADKGGNIRKLDPGLCCFATHVGPYDDFTSCYTALTEWIEKEGYAVSGPPFELYVKGCESNAAPSEYVTEIYFPIRKE